MTPPRVWANGPGGGTPITAASLNGMEADIVAAKVDGTADAVADADAKYGTLPDRLAAVEVLGGLAPGDVNDATSASLIENPDTLTSAALNDAYAFKPDNGARPVGKGELFINVKDYGAKGDGVTDDTTALNNAALAAASMASDALLYMPSGMYKTTGTVTVTTGLDARAATISYTGSGTALIVGTNASAVIFYRKNVILPRVIKAGATSWDGTSIGIMLVNLNTCHVISQFVMNFEQGLVCYGFGGGFGYNTVFPGTLWGNHKNLVLTQDVDGGWCNQNTFFGGRMAYGASWATVDDMSASQVYMAGVVGGVAAPPNNNVFVGTSFECGTEVYYRVTIGGRYNRFLNCRWEALASSIPRIKSLSTADKNILDGGYDVWRVIDVVDAGGRPPALVNFGSVEYHAYAATAKTFTASGATNNQLIDTWTQVNGVQCTHSAGVFTPRAGIWRIEGVIGISCASGSGYRLLTLMKGATALDYDRKAGYAGLMTLRVSFTEVFNGTENFSFYLDQTAPTGSDVTLSSSNRYCRVQATYLGAT